MVLQNNPAADISALLAGVELNGATSDELHVFSRARGCLLHHITKLDELFERINAIMVRVTAVNDPELNWLWVERHDDRGSGKAVSLLQFMAEEREVLVDQCKNVLKEYPIPEAALTYIGLLIQAKEHNGVAVPVNARQQTELDIARRAMEECFLQGNF